MTFIRVETESCELELTDNSVLPLNSLQSAFPGCVGLTYRCADGLKRALRFDGAAFHPPPEGWDAVKAYFVHLSGRQSFPFDSYENASRQFERAVNTVQQLMKTGYGEFGFISPPSPPSPSTNPKERLRSFRRKVADYRIRTTPDASEDSDLMSKLHANDLQLQFSELSTIVNGKDRIIDELRKEIEELTKRNEELTGQSSHDQCKRDIAQWKAQAEGLESELCMLRNMASKQENMGNKVRSLNLELEELRNTSSTKLQSLQLEHDKVCDQLKTLQQQHEMLLREHSKTCHQLDETKKELEEMSHLLEQVKQRFADSERDYETQLRDASECRERIANENVQLSQSLNDVKKEREILIARESDPDSPQNQTLLELREKYEALLEQHEEKIQETASMTELIANLNRHLTEITVRYKDLRGSTDQPNHCMM